MLFTITGKHIEITDAIREHAQAKVDKLPRYFDSITQIEVVIDGKEGGNQSVEIIVHAEHNELLVAREVGSDTYTCLDLAIHKLEGQLRKTKEKQRGHKHVAVDIEKMRQTGAEGTEEDVA